MAWVCGAWDGRQLIKTKKKHLFKNKGYLNLVNPLLKL